MVACRPNKALQHQTAPDWHWWLVVQSAFHSGDLQKASPAEPTCNITKSLCLPIMWAVSCAVVHRGLSTVCPPLWREFAEVHHR